MKKILVIPDIHGRTFWKQTLEKVSLEDYEKVIFLGDYMDPYPFEREITVESALENFKEILDLKKNNYEKVILLLGNHDFYYFYKERGPSRWSFKHHTEIEKMFDENRSCFQLAYETEKTLFSHSGYLAEWAQYCVENDFLEKFEPTAESINSLLKSDEGKRCLEMVSYTRGGIYKYGSCIWADFIEHEDANYNSPYIRTDFICEKKQVFGHTLQLNLEEYYEHDNIVSGKEIIRENLAMLDCRKAFEYDEENFMFCEI